MRRAEEGARRGSAHYDGRRDGSQGRRPLQFCRANGARFARASVRLGATKSVPPPPLARRLRWRSGGPDSRPAARLPGRVLDLRTKKKEIIMTTVQSISDASDRVTAALVSGLESEFGRGAGAALAQHFLAAEE